MAAVQVLPNYAGQYTSESFSTSVTGADTFDLSVNGQFMAQVVQDSGTPAGAIQIQQTNNPGDATPLWANLGAPIDVSVNGAIVPFNPSSGPFGLCRLSSTVNSGAAHLVITGFPNSLRE